MKYAAAFAVLALSLLGQSGAMLEACHMGDKAHPCSCTKHTEQVQNEYLSACLLSRPPGEKRGDSQAACFASMATHCQIIERYGDWHKNEAGEHDQMMPNQCLRACTRSHCRCNPDSEICHIAHDAREDTPPKRR
jgi:hypothetical protein